MTVLGRDTGEIEALVTDRYLDALLAGHPELTRVGPSGAARRKDESPLDAAVRAASRRLAGDLPRFHPSFRFEERLALRLAEAAAAMRVPLAAGSEAEIARIPVTPPPGFDPLAAFPDDEVDPATRPFIVRGAVAASAISLAGAAWYAWRHRPSGSPMARAARAAHAGHGAGGGRGQLSRSGRA